MFHFFPKNIWPFAKTSCMGRVPGPALRKFITQKKSYFLNSSFDCNFCRRRQPPRLRTTSIAHPQQRSSNFIAPSAKGGQRRKVRGRFLFLFSAERRRRRTLRKLVHFCLARTLRKLVILDASWNQKANKAMQSITNLFVISYYVHIAMR